MAENADILLTNAIVLTMDEELNQYDPGSVALSGNSILAVGTDVNVPLLENRSQVEGCATAYVCFDSVCQAPVTRPAALRTLLDGPSL